MDNCWRARGAVERGFPSWRELIDLAMRRSLGSAVLAPSIDNTCHCLRLGDSPLNNEDFLVPSHHAWSETVTPDW
jgi:hypothetical protein